MLLDILRLRQAHCVALLGAGGKSTLRAILERECAASGQPCVFYACGSCDGKCLLLYGGQPPALRPGTDCAVVVAGLGALDWPLREVCAGYAHAFSSDPSRPCDGHDLLYAVRENLRASGLPKAQLRVLLNQADTGMLHVRASDLLRALQDEGLHAAALSLLV